MRRFFENFERTASFCKFFASICFAVFALLSCSDYGFFFGLFGEDDVDDRFATISDFNSFEAGGKNKSLSPAPSNLLPASKYSVLIVTDLHFGSKKADLPEEKFFEWLEKRFQESDQTKIPRFALNLGDTADHGKDSEYAEFLAFEKKIKKIAGKYLYGEDDETPDSERKFKIYSILGNHDLYNNGVGGFLENVFPYKSSYYFSFDADSDDETPGFSYYFLDTANGTTGTGQMDDFAAKIKADTRPKIILTHYPVYAGGFDLFMILQNTLERNALLTLFAENNVKQVYEGHAHRYQSFDYKVFREDVIGSLRYETSTKKQCAIFTVDEATESVTTEVIEF